MVRYDYFRCVNRGMTVKRIDLVIVRDVRVLCRNSCYVVVMSSIQVHVGVRSIDIVASSNIEGSFSLDISILPLLFLLHPVPFLPLRVP